jgi:lysophospholipase L1-like esterase
MNTGLRSLALGLLLTTLAATPGAIYAQDAPTTTFSAPLSEEGVAMPHPLVTPKLHHHVKPVLSATPTSTDEILHAPASPDDNATTESGNDELNEFTSPPLNATHRRLAHAPTSLLVLGDSIAFGEGASDPRLSFAFDVYTHVLIKHPGSTITNRAIPGARIADVTRLELQNIKAPIDLVIIEAGANDVVHASSHDTVAAAMRALISAVKIKFPYAAIIICGIPDLSISPYFVGKAHHEVAVDSALDNAAVKAVALDMDAQFADVYALTQHLRRHASQFLGNDEFHPSDAGHLAIANLLDPFIKKAL